jgi:hypothetical protein
MYKERFEHLMKIFREGAEGKTIDIKALFNEVLALFEELKEEIKKASPEEKKEMMHLMTEMYKYMQQETRKICQNSGMTEEQLIAFSENPANFSPAQWEMIQESRMKIHRAGQGLVKALGPKAPEVHDHSVQPIHKEAKKVKKSNWMRS